MEQDEEWCTSNFEKRRNTSDRNLEGRKTHLQRLDCLQFIRKVLSDCKIRWSLHKAFLDAWQGKIPTEVWLDVIREGIEFNSILIGGLPEGHPFRIRAEAKAAELCAALQPHLQWMEERIARAS